MDLEYYCVECGHTSKIEELERKNVIRKTFYMCPHCDNDRFEIYEV